MRRPKYSAKDDKRPKAGHEPPSADPPSLCDGCSRLKNTETCACGAELCDDCRIGHEGSCDGG